MGHPIPVHRVNHSFSTPYDFEVLFLAILIYVINLGVKGYVRIGGSLLLGITIILGTLYVRNHPTSESAVGTLTPVASEKKSLTTPDSDGDGIEDWEESLTAQVFKSIDTPTTTGVLNTADGYVPPTTFTGKFAEAFFEDYMKGKIKNDGTTDTTELVNGAVTAIENNTKSKEYTPLDIVIVPNSEEAMRSYGNEIASIMNRHSTDNINEAIILKQALDSGDAQMLSELAPIRAAYENFIRDTLLVSVPETLVQEHLTLLTAYEAIRIDIDAMEMAFVDPLYTLARVKRYQDDAAGLYLALKMIASELKNSEVIYTQNEPGTFFYTLGV